MYNQFSLVLTVTHACNMCCGYCYTGNKSARSLNVELGRKAIDRALNSIHPHGVFELGFFGGEPLLHPELIIDCLEHAKRGCDQRQIELRPHATTNGTQYGEAELRVMAWPGMQISVSHDGLPEVHDRHRRSADGRPTSSIVLDTIDRLIEAGCDLSVVMVVRPDTVSVLAEGILFLRDRGVRYFSPTLDLWTTWTKDDLSVLENCLVQCADVWLSGLPHSAISWFDEKAAKIAGIKSTTARCGFGDGEIAVAPSGNLYPCERLIGEDGADNSFRLPGNVKKGENFSPHRAPKREDDNCAVCSIQKQCATTCRCSNFVRTGDIRRPDALLCLLDRICYREAARAIESMRAVQLKHSSQPS